MRTKKEIAEFWVKALAFLGIFLLLLTFFGQILIPKNNKSRQHYYYNGYYGMKKNTIDVLIVGSSNAAESIAVPDIWQKYGYTCYIAGYEAQNVNGAYHMAKNVLKRQHPKLIILETDTLFAHSGLKAAEETLEKEAESYWPVFQFHNRFKKFHISDLTRKPDYRWHPVSHGYSFYIGHLTSKKNYMNSTSSVDHFSVVHFLMLTRLENLCKKNNIKFMLFSAPSPDSWSMAKHNAVAQYAENHKIPFLDLNLDYQKYGLNMLTDTSDGTHLNFLGAKKTALALGAYLKHAYSLTNHKNDPAYVQWSKDYTLYSSYAKKYSKRKIEKTTKRRHALPMPIIT